MYELCRISLMHWNLLDIVDIPIRGMTALIGPVGVGKSTIVDAMQTIMTGNQSTKIRLNSAASALKSQRTVRDYCLGVTEDTIAQKTTRKTCHSILAMTFRETALNHHVSIGLVLYADEDMPKEKTEMRWIAPGVDFSFEAFADRGSDCVIEVEGYEAVMERVRHAAGARFETINHAAGAFVARYQRIMRPSPHKAPDSEQFLKRFRNAIAFEEISDPTQFVRSFVLDESSIQTEGLRANLSHWDELENEMARVKAKLADARYLMNRHRQLAIARADEVRHDHDIAWYELRTVQIELARAEAEVGLLTREIDEKESQMTAIEGRAAAEREEANRKKDRTWESGAGEAQRVLDIQIQSLESDLRRERNALSEQLRPLANLAKLTDQRRYLPGSFKAVETAARRLGAYRAELEAGREAQLEDFAGEVKTAAAVERALEALGQNEAGLAQELSGLRAEAGEIEAALANRRGRGVSLSQVTEAFSRHLGADSITAKALPELVDLADKDEAWVIACEAVLGAFREAVFVAPEHYAAAADRLRELKRSKPGPWHQIRLVKTARLAREPAAAPRGGAVIEILHPMADLGAEEAALAGLAMRFLAAQFGRIVRAETMAEIEADDAAIMKDGTQSQRLSIRVSRDTPPIIGRLAQARLAEDLRRRKYELAEEVPAAERRLNAFKSARVLLQIVADLEVERIVEGQVRLEAAQDRLAKIREERAAALDPELAALMREIGDHNRQADDLERQARVARGEAMKARERRAARVERCEALEGERAVMDRGLAEVRGRFDLEPFPSYARALKRLKEPYPGIGDGSAPVLEIAWTGAAAGGFDEVAGGSGSLEGCKERLRQVRRSREDVIVDLERHERYTRLITKFIQDYGLPAEVAERHKSEIFHWLIDVMISLQENTLLNFEERIRTTRRETMIQVRESLVMNLWDKLEGALREMKALNHRLRQHHFEGMTYLFDWSIDPDMRPLYKLISRVRRDQEEAAKILDEGGDPVMNEALALVRNIFANTCNTAKFEDYRNFLRFELRMTRDRIEAEDVDAQSLEQGGANIRFTGSLTSRVGTGSGGQRQTPFYVAIAASMAAAYFPGGRSGDQNGMGLVCFDEAFSKLDILNTQELLRFFRDLGLQVIVATPEDKRATIMELADTIVNIRKSWDGTQLFLTSAAIGGRAREEMARANPDRLGRDHFRQLADAQRAQAAE